MSGPYGNTSNQGTPWNGPEPQFTSLGGPSQRTSSVDIWPSNGPISQSQNVPFSNGLSLGHLNASITTSENGQFENSETTPRSAHQSWTATTHQVVVNNTSSRPPTRKPRSRPPGDLQWQQNKVHIERLYMKERLPLPIVVEKMEKEYKFSASERMYKNKFKTWRWSKNIPHEVAMWMTEKARERTPKETIFTWNEQKWTDKKIVDKYGKTLNNQVTNGICAPTPRDVTYETPESFAGDPQQHRTVVFESQNQEGEEGGRSTYYLDTMPVNVDPSQTTLTDLRRLLDRARRAASAGAIEDANTDFRDAVSGFRFKLSPTHDETLRAGYLYASFHANCTALDKADAVLNWMSEKHVERWGSGHEKTCLHYARTIQLLRSWGRQEHAELLVHKILDDTGNEGDEGLARFTASQPRNSLADIDLQQSFPETDDPNSMSRQLDKIDLAVISGIAGFEDILKVIIKHCEEKLDDPRVSLQACRAKCSLAKLHMNAGNVEETRRALKNAKTSLEPLLVVGEEPMARTTFEAARRLARMFFEIKDEISCNAILDQVIASVESRRYIIGCNTRLDDMVLFDFIESVAFQFYNHGSQEQSRYWAERGLGLAMKLNGSKCAEARRFQKILENADFGVRSSTSVDDLMSISGGVFSISVISN